MGLFVRIAAKDLMVENDFQRKESVQLKAGGVAGLSFTPEDKAAAEMYSTSL